MNVYNNSQYSNDKLVEDIKIFFTGKVPNKTVKSEPYRGLVMAGANSLIACPKDSRIRPSTEKY